MKTLDDVRTELTRRLRNKWGIELSEVDWEWAKEERWPSTILQSENAREQQVELEDAVVKIERFHRHARRAKQTPRQPVALLELSAGNLSTREGVTALLIAKEAAKRDDVETFREQLPDRRVLFALRPTVDWIWGQLGEAPREGQVADGIRHVVGTVASPELDEGLRLLEQSQGPITEAGLGLRALATRLADDYGWSFGQAVVFVLMDLPPALPAIQDEIQASHSFTALTRIVLTVDPSTPASEVAERYRRARQEIHAGRFHELSARHRALASFVLLRPDCNSWDERQEAWNKEHPNWRYSKTSNMRRDWAQAQKNLLYWK